MPSESTWWINGFQKEIPPRQALGGEFSRPERDGDGAFPSFVGWLVVGDATDLSSTSGCHRSPPMMIVFGVIGFVPPPRHFRRLPNDDPHGNLNPRIHAKISIGHPPHLSTTPINVAASAVLTKNGFARLLPFSAL